MRGRDGAPPSSPVVVDTPSGRVRGRRSAGVDRFRGVPYGEAPIGPLRFGAPVRRAPWPGVLDATLPPRRAVQPTPRVIARARRLGRDSPPSGEDCLLVDVVAPSDAAAAPRPVLVWVHGGAYRVGSGADYDGAPLALLGDIVVVSVSYRLGAFGFLDLADALGSRDGRWASNAGLLDVVSALEWVRDSIAAFGGDARRVTIAGSSAGAGIVTSLMSSPCAEGLFAGVIAQSGAPSFNTGATEAAETAREFLLALGIGAEDTARLETVPARRVLSAMRRVNALHPDGLPFRPWFDGDVLPGTRELSDSAPTAPVPLLIGTNRDEHRLFTTFRIDVVPRTRERIGMMLVAEHGRERAADILRHYPRDRSGLARLGTDGVFTMPAAQLADRHSAVAPTFRYRLDLSAARFHLGAFHSIELLLLFDWPAALDRALLGRPNSERTALAGRMRREWVGFVRDGHPGPDWPVYETATRQVRVFDAVDTVESDPDGDRRRLWRGAEIPVS